MPMIHIIPLKLSMLFFHSPDRYICITLYFINTSKVFDGWGYSIYLPCLSPQVFIVCYFVSSFTTAGISASRSSVLWWRGKMNSQDHLNFFWFISAK